MDHPPITQMPSTADPTPSQRPATSPPSALLALPDELLTQISLLLQPDLADTLALSLTCHRLHALLPHLSRRTHHRLTHHRTRPHRPGLPCTHARIRRYLDRPHDARSLRWCFACYDYCHPDHFTPGSGTMACTSHPGMIVMDRIPWAVEDGLYDALVQLRRTHTDVELLQFGMEMCVHCGKVPGCVPPRTAAVADGRNGGSGGGGVRGAGDWDYASPSEGGSSGLGVGLQDYLVEGPSTEEVQRAFDDDDVGGSDWGSASDRSSASVPDHSDVARATECKCDCTVCGKVQVPVYVYADSSLSGQGNDQRAGVGHGGRMIGVPGVGVATREGRRFDLKYEFQEWALPREERKWVVVLKLEEM